MKKFQSYINGTWIDSSTGEIIVVDNPATEEIVGEVACASNEDVDLAVEAAKKSFLKRDLVDMHPMERSKLMRTIAIELRNISKEAGKLLCYENGKLLSGAEYEFQDAANYFDYYGGLTDKLEGSTIPVSKGVVDYTILEPYGVSAHIIPWNYPISMIGRSLACSIATGNSTVIKTPELAPLAAASYLTRNQKRNTIKDWFVVLVAILSSSFLIFKQPDLGTALIVLASGCIPVFLAGFPLLILIILIMVVIISSPFLWASLTPYMQQRVITLFNPESDLLGAGWNISQSKTAIGSGGFWGKGYLNGTQSQLDFIPESHSDFIFSVIGEEFGFLGIFFLLMLYGIILYRVFKIALNSSTEFSRLATTSIGFIFLIYIWINVSMTVGTLPVVGVPLPLISQGGTSILIHLVAFGFVLSMKRRQTW